MLEGLKVWGCGGFGKKFQAAECRAYVRAGFCIGVWVSVGLATSGH